MVAGSLRLADVLHVTVIFFFLLLNEGGMQDQNYLMCFNFEVNGGFLAAMTKCPLNELTSDGVGTRQRQHWHCVQAESVEHGVHGLSSLMPTYRLAFGRTQAQHVLWAL